MLDEDIIANLDDNDMLFYCGKEGVRVYAKFRGCTAEDIGRKCGMTIAGLQSQIVLLRGQMKDKGKEAMDEFNRGYNVGLKKDIDRAGIRLIDRPIQPDQQPG